MNQNILLLLLAMCFNFLSIHLYSQSKYITLQCGFDDCRNWRSEISKKNEALFHENWRNFITSNERQASSKFTLPVVFHIIHNNGPENISDAMVYDCLDQLNLAFSHGGDYLKGPGVNTDIQFCLAKRDPFGFPTNGITRTQSALTVFDYENDDLTVKNLMRWEPKEYINIWIVKDICGYGNCSVLGYAYYPSSHGNLEDGIVVEAANINGNSSNAAILAHEMGHYLGLPHTFNGDCENNNCLVEGDGICDTPPDGTTDYSPCNNPSNSCTTDEDDISINNPFRPVSLGGIGDQVDLISNFMDYSKLDCYTGFTNQQSQRQHFTIENIRYSLIESSACNNPCPAEVIASITNAPIKLEVGSTFTLVNGTINANNYKWYFDGILTSNNSNFTYTYNQIGTFTISLVAFSNNPDCFRDSISIKVNIVCSQDKASFTVTKEKIDINESLNCINNSSNPNNIKWYINGILQSTNKDYIFSSPTPGIFQICLETSNQFCKSEYCILINVKSDTQGQGFCNTPGLYLINGNPGDNTAGTCLVANNAGEIFLGGYINNSACILKLNEYGKIIKSKIFDFVSNMNYISSMIVDSDGRIVGCGFNPGSTGFIFKYDPFTDQVLWNKLLASSREVWKIIELPNKGDYVIFSNPNKVPSPGAADDAHILSVNRNTGIFATINNQYNKGSSECFYDALVFNGDFYACGRITYDNGFSDFRSSLSKFDINGNLAWTKTYLVPPSNIARMYAFSFKEDNNTFLVAHTGHINGTNFGSSSVFLTKHDLNGELLWQKEYSLPSYSNIVNGNVEVVSDGYLMYLFELKSSNNNHILVIKTDKLGNKSWAREYAFGKNNSAYSLGTNKIIHANNKLYFTGINFETNKMILAILENDGTVNGCDKIKDVDVTVSDFTNNSSYPVQLFKYDGFNTLSDFPTNIQDFTFTSTALCTPPCNEICNNGLDDDNDGKIDCDDSDCTAPDAAIQLDSIKCTSNGNVIYFTLCNIGDDTLNAGLPITISNLNPLTNPNTSILDTLTLKTNLIPGACQKFQSNALLSADSIFVFANHTHFTKPKLNLKTYLPLSGISECDYQNNILGTLFPKTPPPPDLGPDITICKVPSDSILTAPFGYTSCIWSTGATTSSIKITQAGQYWVQCLDACGGIYSDTMQAFYTPPPKLEIGPDVTICANGVHPIQATPGFNEYVWQDGHDGPDYTAFLPGIVICSATDACGFVHKDSLHVTWDKATQLELGPDLNICDGDSTLYNVNTPPGYKLKWYPNTSVNCDTCNIVKWIGNIDTTFIVTAFNNAGCFSSDSLHVKFFPVSNLNIDTVFCSGSPVIFLGTTISADTQICIQYISQHGCDSNLCYNVSLLPGFNISAQVQDEKCAGDKNGSIALNTSGGITPFTFQWNNGSFNDTITQLSPGMFEVTVTDGNKCKTVQQFSIKEGNKVILDLGPDLMICSGKKEQFNVNVPLDYIVQWSPPTGVNCDTCKTIEWIGTNTTSYTVKTTDQDGCSASDNILVQFFPNADVQLDTVFCSENPVAFLGNVISSDTTICLQLSTQHNCDSNLCYQILLLPALNVTANVQHIECSGFNNGSIYLNIIGATFPWTTLWSNGFSGDSLMNLGPGTYQVTITDVNGCRSTQKYSIDGANAQDIAMYVPNVFSPDNNGINDRFDIYLTDDCIIDFEIHIYDKWGGLVHYSKIPQPGWDGRTSNGAFQPGVYTWYITLKNSAGKLIFKKGDVTIFK